VVTWEVWLPRASGYQLASGYKGRLARSYKRRQVAKDVLLQRAPAKKHLLLHVQACLVTRGVLLPGASANTKRLAANGVWLQGRLVTRGVCLHMASV
jgi:hypothetical protein